MKRRGPPPFAPPPHGYGGYGGPPKDWDGYRPYGRRGDYPPSPRSYKRGRSNPPSRPIRTELFEFRLEKLVIGEYVAVHYSYYNLSAKHHAIESGENNEGEDRLRFYLKNSNNDDSKPDSIALTVKDGQQRIVIDASNIDSIELSQKTGHFHFKVNGEFKTQKLENANFIECEEDPSGGQLAVAKNFDCYVDMRNPITVPKDTEPNIQKWSSQTSRYREILRVLDADAPRTLEDVIADWAKSSPVGLASERLLFAKIQLKKDNRLFEIISTLAHAESAVGPAVDMLMSNFQETAEGKLTKEEVEDRVKSMIMALPESAILKSLDILWANESDKL
ncbi:hypothetical protein BGW37DRAFT_522995 [Umbelopsis sp. PMI_123]|nr:hypothetical protein BGW37DRAFT_522995 [Umbelopsis sp. PMI_123]